MSWWDRRQARHQMAVYGCLAAGDEFVTQVWERIGGGAFTIVALVRLEQQGLIRSEWDDRPAPPGEPRRRRYQVIPR